MYYFLANIQVITPEEITNPKVDELSVMTYVSYFPEAKLKPGAPLRTRTHPSAKCFAKGPGVEPKGLVVKKPANFTVFTQGAGVGKLAVSVWGPGKVEEEVIVQDNGDHTYSCQYFPQKQGIIVSSIISMHDAFVRDPLLIIPCGGKDFRGGLHDFQREGRGDQSSPTEYKGETIKN